MTVIILSLFLCFVTAIILLLLKRKGLKDSVPLAPFVFAGTFLAMILGG
jgi:prepilin signal peptidase PulO-like enzyme (type II secretory pathway)